MREIRLKGRLGEICGEVHRIEVASVHEAVRAMCVRRPVFGDLLASSQYQILVGETAIDVEDVRVIHADEQPFTFVPVINGSSGVDRVFTGLAMMATTFVASYLKTGSFAVAGAQTLGKAASTSMADAALAAVGTVGTSLVLGGLCQLLTPLPTLSLQKSSTTSSDVFAGATNTTQQGVPVPLLYGRLIVGGAVISSGVSTTDVAT
jgi:predicted phage tail protein